MIWLVLLLKWPLATQRELRHSGAVCSLVFFPPGFTVLDENGVYREADF